MFSNCGVRVCNEKKSTYVRVCNETKYNIIRRAVLVPGLPPATIDVAACGGGDGRTDYSDPEQTNRKNAPTDQPRGIPSAFEPPSPGPVNVIFYVLVYKFSRFEQSTRFEQSRSTPPRYTEADRYLYQTKESQTSKNPTFFVNCG